ncbi:Mut7-C RNAse domain-containing protein [Halosimplex rubrum]|uniref:Mut7-C RNAse domain-containing protein n=1 Tax=Halosimplex rubrum TaxID=869889 RepID=A0A7D5TEL9_9EURY|nr:Mut7-C RNAse domain-containing protein [Halosimplex rubrum]
MTGDESDTDERASDRRASTATADAVADEGADRGDRGGRGDGDGGEFPQEPAGETALLLDTMLGKLATYLRMCGYDAAYAGERGIEADDDVLALAHTEGRVLVTRDRELAARAERSQPLSTREVTEQLLELRRSGFDLELADEPARCSACNGPLERVDRTEPTPDYAPETHEETVWRCRNCGQHFWKGSHWDDVAGTLDDL